MEPEPTIRSTTTKKKEAAAAPVMKYAAAAAAAAAAVILLGLIALSCCISAEFSRVKDKDMRLDGSLCSMPTRPAFPLGVTALACLSLAQILGTTTTILLAGNNNNKKKKTRNSTKRNQALSITLLVMSWITFAVAAVLLGTASSMSNRQPYGRGWMDGECYVVKDGIFLGAAVLVALTLLLIIGFAFLTRREIRPPRTGPDDDEIRSVVVLVDDRLQEEDKQQQQLHPSAIHTGPTCQGTTGPGPIL